MADISSLKCVKKVYNLTAKYKHKPKKRKACRRWYNAHKEQQHAYMQKYHSEHPDNHRNRTRKQWHAQSYVWQHPELKAKTCELCDETKDLVAHHLDYDYPHIFVTICRSCHNWLHKSINEGGLKLEQFFD